VVDRFRRLTVALVPGARPAVQFGHTLEPLLQQAGMQHVRKEMVVAIPASVVVERDHEQVRSLQ
jgi:hypothetical protein